MNDIQYSLNDVLVMMLAVAGIVCLCFLIICLIKLSKVIDKVDSVCDDAKNITSIASKRVEEVDSAIDSAAEYFTSIVLKIQQISGIKKVTSGVTKALTNIGSIFKRNK